MVSHKSQGNHHNNGTEAPVGDAGSIFTSSHDNRKVSREDIELVAYFEIAKFCLVANPHISPDRLQVEKYKVHLYHLHMSYGS